MGRQQEHVDLHYIRGGAGQERLSDALVAVHDPLDVASEAYRMLRTNLFYAVVDDPPEVIVVTSPDPREGKSTTCANLGVVLAQAGKSVLLLDCDLRNPAQHKLFGIGAEPGMLEAISGARKLPAVWHEPVAGLKVVPAGHTSPNPSEVLGSRRFADLLSRAREQFDYVLLDTPPVRLVSDSVVLARQGDGVLLVLDAEETGKRSLRQAVRVLDGVGARIMGTVTNRAPVEAGVYGYGYYGGT